MLHGLFSRIVAEVGRSMSLIEQIEATVEAYLKGTESPRQSILRLMFNGRLGNRLVGLGEHSDD
jgi:hypothetical protein